MKKSVRTLFVVGLLGSLFLPTYAQHKGGFLKSGKASSGRTSLRTKKTFSKIGKRFGKHSQGNHIAAQLQKEVSVGTVAAQYLDLQSYPGITHNKWEKGWHAAVTHFLPQEYRDELPISYAKDVLLGRIPLEILSDAEKENLFLSKFPMFFLESDFIPTDSQWETAISYYHSVLFDQLPETEPADELHRWARKMAAITNLGFLGHLEQGQWIEVAAWEPFPPQWQPFTDLIVVRALLNIGEEIFIKDFVAHRLKATDKKGRPLKLPAVWNDFPQVVLQYVPQDRIEPPAADEPSAAQRQVLQRVTHYFQRQKARFVKPQPLPGSEALQYALGRYNSYNILNLDSSLEMTQLYMELQHGMSDKFSDFVFGRSSNLREQLEYRLDRSFDEAKLFNERKDLPLLFPFVSKEWIYWDSPLPAEQLYPYAANFLTDRLLPWYMLIKHNLEVRKWWPVIQQWQGDVLEAVNYLPSIQVPLTHDSSMDMRWLAGQITPEIKYVLVGDLTFKPSYLRDVFALALELRKRHPRRDIILLSQTGFGLPEGMTDEPAIRKMFEEKGALDYLIQAEENGILVQSVRDQYIRTEWLHNPFYANTSSLPATLAFEVPPSLAGNVGRLGQTQFADTFEGLRLISEFYLGQLEDLREANPDALFIVAADAKHVDYAMPYSLGSYLAGPETYVALLGKQHNGMPVAEELSLFEQNLFPFEMARAFQQGQLSETGEPQGSYFLTDRVLQFRGTVPCGEFKKPIKAAWLVGFDARINRPEN